MNDFEMNTTFFKKSQEIANEFLQNIVFLDDKAFKDGNNRESQDSRHAFDPFEISKAFAKEKKICAVYNPLTKKDIDDFKQISKKADVVILDWFIEIQNEEAGEDPTADAEDDEPRGQYTKQIINELVNGSGNGSLKLIVVYTGEDILDEIAEEIHGHISNPQFNLVKNNCEVCSSNIRILVRAKSNGDGADNRFGHRSHLQDKVLQYENLPSFILNEFTAMTSGLLSNFALLSLSTIRNNSHKILSLFSNELDAPYMGHKAILPVQNDSEDLLLKLFGDTISDLLHYSSISHKIQNELIDIWIDSNINDEQFTVNGKNFQRTKVLLKTLIHSEKENLEERFDDVFNGSPLSRSDKKIYRESKSTELFLNNAHQDKKDKINSDFAILTHHKSLFLPINTAPKLTLGTIIRSMTNQDNYYVCIQQRCDSVRLKKDEERKFLFLPLMKTNNDKFQIITPDGTKLRLNKKTYSIKTIKFKCNCEEREVKGTKSEDGKFTFKEIYEQGDTFEWVLDLKDLHSQRIVTNYVASLSRIGLDESEWLRIAGN
ncbi:response regulator receiver domain [Capnocytophaga canimorsus]|uniref:response regulator receiver domain n=1 Tax=Capnocytophaga canimorsus TaxID=28188 RepID=UPI0015623F1A|nr:response regulator receiver domain [Capnocytophaga canimorsus]